MKTTTVARCGGSLGWVLLMLGLTVLLGCDGAPEPRRSVAVGTAAVPSAATAVVAQESAAHGPAATAAPKLAAPPRSAQPLVVKRFVVARSIQNREPVEGESIRLGEVPVFAFVELENPSPEEASVLVTFEKDGSGRSVGNVALPVPGGSKRWRTWAASKLVDQAGHWTAVLRDQTGAELGRAGFDVVPLTTVPERSMPPAT